MQPIRFVHAADLHLDTAFSGVSREAPPELIELLREASFIALRRLFDLCVREKPDFLLLSGDIYNQEDRSLRAQLALHDGCSRLEEAGIRVFIIHGNHDPLSSRLRTLCWPSNVTVFTEEVASIPVYRNAQATDEQEHIATVYGISHATARETRNLAALFHRTTLEGNKDEAKHDQILHIAMLHATPGDADGNARYAPFSLEDLQSSGMDYWALGHIHQRREVCTSPLALYPGCMQGLHINEQGEKGCLLVTATPGANGTDFELTTTFRPLGPVVWQSASIAFEEEKYPIQPDADTSSALENTEIAPDESLALDGLETRLRAELDKIAENLWPGCKAVIVRVSLSGRTACDGLLRRERFAADLLDRLRESSQLTGVSALFAPPLTGDKSEHTSSGPLVWIKDLEVHTRPPFDRALLLERGDLLGGVFQLAESARAEKPGYETVRHEALGTLFESSRARKALPPLTDEEIERLLDDAESLCIDLLEND